MNTNIYIVHMLIYILLHVNQIGILISESLETDLENLARCQDHQVLYTKPSYHSHGDSIME